MSYRPCTTCRGERLRPEVLAVTVGGINIMEFCHMPVRDSLKFIKELQLTEKEQMIAAQIIKEIRSRLQFLSDVGLTISHCPAVWRRCPAGSRSESAWLLRSVPVW